MRLEQLEEIIAIESCKSFSQAAKKLFVSQPSLSVAVNNLEEELGIQIFRRSSVGVMPTAEGKEVLRLAHQITSEIEQMKGLHSGNASMRGEVKLLLLPAAANAIAAELLLSFHEQFPNVRLLIEERPSREMLDALAYGQCNIAFAGAGGLPGEQNSVLQTLHKRNIAYEITHVCPFCAIMSSQNPLSSAPSVTLEALGRYRFLECSDNISMSLTEIISLQDFQDKLMVYDRSVLCELVARDQGVSIFPSYFGVNDVYFRQGAIVSRPIADLTLRVPQAIMYTTKVPLSFLEEKLIDTLREIVLARLPVSERVQSQQTND